MWPGTAEHCLGWAERAIASFFGPEQSKSSGAAAGLLGKEKCSSSCHCQEKWDTVGMALYLQKESQSSENPTEIVKGCETGHNRVPSYWKGSFIVLIVMMKH